MNSTAEAKKYNEKMKVTNKPKINAVKFKNTQILMVMLKIKLY